MVYIVVKVDVDFEGHCVEDIKKVFLSPISADEYVLNEGYTWDSKRKLHTKESDDIMYDAYRILVCPVYQ